jgi:hypothetical protein
MDRGEAHPCVNINLTSKPGTEQPLFEELEPPD